MQLPGVLAVLGLDVRSGSPAIPLVSRCADILFHPVDASPNFRNASIFNDSPKSGFGGWGDPNDDYQITTGALAQDFKVAYPVPHRVRRNYTVKVEIADPFGDGTPPPPDEVWKYFTPASQKELIQGYVGDFEGFQTEFESTIVS